MSKLKGNCILAQSGGPTAVINSSIAGAVLEAKKYPEIKGIYGAINGILGVLKEDIIDLNKESLQTIKLLKKTPSSALGSSRYKLKEVDYEEIMNVLKAHNIRYFFIAGGNDSMDTADKISKLAKEKNYELRVLGIPKTVDNDLVITDHCPGYGSVARWLSIATRDVGLDNEAIYTSDTVKIIETMGRNTGWITASTALAKDDEDKAPHLIYLPEVVFKPDKFLSDVDKIYKKLGRVVITCCEGLKGEDGEYLTASKREIDTDKFGHKQLGGVGEYLVNLIAENLKIKARCDNPGTIQRVSIVHSSSVDLKEAVLVGKMAIKFALSGITDQMITLLREPTKEYRCKVGLAKLSDVANKEKKVPKEFINPEGNFVTKKFIEYVKPLIGKELPEYCKLRKYYIKKKIS